MGKYSGLQGLETCFDENGLPLNLTRVNDVAKLTLTDAEKEYCEHFGVELPIDVFVNRKNQCNYNMAHTGLMATDIPTEVSRTATKVLNYMIQEVPNLVDCATQEEYDAKAAAMKEEIKNMGYDVVADFYRDSFTKAVEEFEKLEG